MGKSAPKHGQETKTRGWWRLRMQSPPQVERPACGERPGRRLSLERLESRAMLASDLLAASVEGQAGARIEEAVASPAMEVRVEVSRLDGSPATTLQTGEPFLLTVATRDLRPEPEGVFAVYVDVRWNADRALVVGPAAFAAPFVNAPSGTPRAGELDELGAFAGLEATGKGRYAVVQVPMQAVAPGGLDFALHPADELPMHALLLYGRDDMIDPAEVRMVGASVVVEGGPLVPEGGSEAEQTLADGSSSDAEALLVAGTLETASPLGAGTDGGASAEPAASDSQNPGRWPESDLLFGDADGDPLRRLDTSPSASAETSEPALPAEENLASDGGTTADPQALLG